MPIKSYKPTTPSRRQMQAVDFSQIDKKSPEKSLTFGKKNNAARDNLGHLSVRHQGGGAKRKFRKISSLHDRKEIEAKVKFIEYDPNRSSFIALIEYKDHNKAYIIAPHKIKKGDKLICQDKSPLNNGNRLKLKNIPAGIEIYDLEITPGQGGTIARSAGSAVMVAAQAKEEGKGAKYVQVKMPSGEIRLIHGDCFASIGRVSNLDHNSIKIGKAGRKRWMRIRPTVRGTAMHPAAHPHGGGEGRSPVGLKHPKTPWGKPAMGYKTRKNSRTSKFIIKRIN